ncbi:CBS domain-containing protein [Sphingomonas daechungensis]|nr:CBS domain-containing protein [Sphingomonas daechungensis]
MTGSPKTIRSDALIDDALAMFDEHRITTLFVVEGKDERRRPIGILHIHDCPVTR